MQTTLQTAPETFRAAVKIGAAKPGSWIILIIAALLLPFANGGHAIPLAAWLAPFFLLRFTRRRRTMIVVPVVLSLQIIALAIQYRGMVPFPTPIYIAVMVFYGLCSTLPYLGDRLLSQRLPVFIGTLVFPLLLTSIEYLLSLGPFGSWFATP